MSQPPPRFPPPNLSSEDLIPTAPYFDLPAGLMHPLVKVRQSDDKLLSVIDGQVLKSSSQ